MFHSKVVANPFMILSRDLMRKIKHFSVLTFIPNYRHLSAFVLHCKNAPRKDKGFELDIRDKKNPILSSLM